MASERMSKSQQIRVFLDQHPDASAEDVRGYFQRHHVSVTNGLIYQVMHTSKKHYRRKAKRRPEQAERHSTTVKSLGKNGIRIDIKFL